MIEEQKQEKKIILRMVAREANTDEADKMVVNLYAGLDKDNLKQVSGALVMTQEVYDEFWFTMSMGHTWWEIERGVLEFDPNPPPPIKEKVKRKARPKTEQ